MRPPYCFLLIGLLLLCSTQTIAFAQSGTYQTIPESLRGYWQFKADNVSDWNGPLIGENFVENYYVVFYAEQIKQEADGSYFFHLRNQKGDTTEFRITPTGNDAATIWYKGWKEPKNCIRKQVPDHTEPLTPLTLPDRVYQKWVKGLSGKVIYEFTRDGKLLYDGKAWDILSAGYFLNKEYRLLVKNGETYKLLYLSFPFPKTMNVAADLQNEKVSPIASHPEIYAFAGCWINQATGDWRIGFFEDFAVYQCQFWDYESINIQKNRTTIILKNGTEQLKVRLTRKDETSCTLSVGKEKAQTYVLCNDKYLPDYPVADTTPFVDNGYQTDSVTLIGYLRNLPSTRPFGVDVPDMITNNEEEYTTEIDSLGRFTLRFPVLNSHNVFIDWGRTTIWTSVEPGETYFLYVDFADGKKLVMGEKARILNELLAHEGLSEYIGYDEGEKMDNMEYLQKTQDIIRHKSEYRAKMLNDHPFLSHKFRYYTEQEILCNAARDLMQRRFSVDRNKQEHLQPEFMSYVDSALYPRPVEPYTLLRDYGSFLRDYVGYITDIAPASSNRLTVTPQKMEMLYLKFDRDGKIQLSQEEKDALHAFSNFEREIEKMKAANTADSLTMAAYNKKMEPSIKTIQDLVGRDEIFNDYMMGNLLANSINRTLAIIDSLQMDEKLKEILKTNCYYEMLQQTHKEMPDSLINKFKAEVSNPSLQAYVLNQQRVYEEISHKAIEYPESLMPNEPLAEITDGEQLFRKIIEPYKGKVVYLDVWGTWCGPCKDMMQYAGSAKKLFDGKDVIFLYLSNRSSDKSWKNIIKEYGLTGKIAVHYNLPDEQQRAIEKFLQVRSFPTYILIDKEGNIVNRDAPRPNRENDLLNAVYKLLEK